jgi:hypothetical protein
MRLKLDEITHIAREVAAEQHPPLEVVAVSSGGGSERVELLVTITGCHVDPCRVIVSLSRGDRDDIEQQLRLKFRAALAHHRAH